MESLCLWKRRGAADLLASSKCGKAFAAIMGDGSVVTWGDPEYGGDSSHVQEQLRNVQYIQAVEDVFAAVLEKWTVVTWVILKRW